MLTTEPFTAPELGSPPKGGFPTARSGVFSSGDFTGEITMQWHGIDDEKEKYAAYLCSREWAELREQVRSRCQDRCERCATGKMEVVHHLTYARKYQERIDDLAGWCRKCHDFNHGKSDEDPRIETRAVELQNFVNQSGGSGSWIVCPICGAALIQPVAHSFDESSKQFVIDFVCENKHGCELRLQHWENRGVMFWRNFQNYTP